MSEHDQPTTSTIAKCLVCHRVIFAVVDDSQWLKEAEADIMELIQSGHSIYHVSHQYVRDNFGCQCPKWTQGKLLLETP